MSRNTGKVKFVEESIRQAFKDSPYPGDSNLVTIKNSYDFEEQEIFESFVGKHWEEVSLDTLKLHHEALCFFKPEAYRFYLPAYLLATAKSYYQAGNIPGSVVSCLNISNMRGHQRERFIAIMSGFSDQQKKAILSFLRFLQQKYSANYPGNELNRVIGNFWIKFE
ncbi:MAG: DUF6714 family protein [Spirulinaceae cyanobacterium]